MFSSSSFTFADACNGAADAFTPEVLPCWAHAFLLSPSGTEVGHTASNVRIDPAAAESTHLAVISKGTVSSCWRPRTAKPLTEYPKSERIVSRRSAGQFRGRG